MTKIEEIDAKWIKPIEKKVSYFIKPVVTVVDRVTQTLFIPAIQAIALVVGSTLFLLIALWFKLKGVK